MYRPIFTITDEILTRIAQIEGLRGAANNYKILPEREAFVRRRATIEATHSSTSIEGNPLNYKQVEKTLSSRSKLNKTQYAEIEVKNYQKTLQWISRRSRNSEKLTLQDILAIHSLITSRLLDKTRSGKLRRYPVYIENQDGEIVYDGPEAKIVEKELIELLDWLNSDDNQTHPIIIAGILHYMLVSIHPFADGNGRTARATVSLYLSLTDYDFHESLVLDSYYAVDRRAYYDALSASQKKNYHNAKNADLTPWLDYFTEGFLSSAEVLSVELQTLAAVHSSITPKKIPREESDILSYVAQFGSVDLSEAMEILPEASKRTVQRKLKELVTDGYLEMSGNGPSTKYILKENWTWQSFK